MVSAYVGNDEVLKQRVLSFWKSKTETDVVKEYQNSKYYRKTAVSELLRIDYSNPRLLDEAVACTPNDTVSRREIWDENPQIVLRNGTINPDIDVIRTITTKQDRNPNSGNLYFDSGIAGRGTFRYLTPRECFLFMGFTDEDYDNVIKNNPEVRKNSCLFPRDKLIRMAGNSIPVKLLEGIFLQIMNLDKALKE
jgi:DNA (cytosine-5)-methyltransferase 1